MKHAPRIYTSGFIALTSAIIISAVLVALMFSTSASGLYARFNALGGEYKRMSLALAESCSNLALLKLAQNYDYVGGEAVAIGSDNCNISIISSTTVSSVPPTTIDKKKKVFITTSAQYPLGTGSWSTSKIEAEVINPSIALVVVSPSCNSFTIAPSSQINSGQSVSLAWNISNANSVEIKRVMGANTTTLGSGLPTSGAGAVRVDSPSESATYVAIAYGNSGTVTQCAPVSIAVKPAVGECADTVVMLDRTGSMSPTEREQENFAVKKLLALYDSVSTALMGIGSFGGLDGSAASVPATSANGYRGWLTANHGVATSTGTLGFNLATTTVNPKSWLSMNNAFQTDTAVATTSTNGAQQGYTGFGFSIPAASAVLGIEVLVQAKISGSSPPITSGTLYPNGQGTYIAWTGGEGDVDETSNFDCSSGDSIVEGTIGDRESVDINLSSIPDGATITSVRVFTYDRGDSQAGGAYQTFARLNGTNTDATSTLAAVGSSSGCSPAKSQYIDVPDTLKSSSTGLEVGVTKMNGNNNTVRVGAINAVVSYIQPASIGVNLSSNNGANWSSTQLTTGALTTTLAPYTLGGAGVLWGLGATPANIGALALRLQNNAPSGMVVSVDSVSARVYYQKPSTELYNVIDLMMQTTSSVGSQLDVALQKGNAELNSTRHVVNAATGKYPKKVLLLISDGAPSSPSTNQKTINEARVATTSTATPDTATTTIFTITYGANSAGQSLMRTVASTPAQAFTSPTLAGIATIFDTIGATVCPAATAPTAPAPPPPAPPPPVPPANISIGSWQEIVNP